MIFAIYLGEIMRWLTFEKVEAKYNRGKGTIDRFTWTIQSIGFGMLPQIYHAVTHAPSEYSKKVNNANLQITTVVLQCNPKMSM